MYEGGALWFRKPSHSEVLQLRKIGVNDFIEIVDNDEASSPSQVKKRPHHTSCVSKEARYQALAL